MVDVSSLTTISTHLILGSLSFCTCFFTVASKARSGVKRPVLHPGRRRGWRRSGHGRVGRQAEGVKARQGPGPAGGWRMAQAWGERERHRHRENEREQKTM